MHALYACTYYRESGMNSEEHSYEEGRRDGRIEALERRIDWHDKAKENHERRLLYLERIAASMLAIIAFTTVLPKVMEFIGRVATQ